MWQALHDELQHLGFTVMTVALDRSADDARPWIEDARPTHPSLIDTRHLIADLYNIVNVPTVLWIDEGGRIVRPNDVAFATDTFVRVTGVPAAPRLAAIRAWVRGEVPVASAAEIRAQQTVPTVTDQQARAEFALGQWLYERGRSKAALPHFVRAGELAPHDFTIRRGTMPMRDVDPMGGEFRAMHAEWTASGRPYYRPLT